MPLSHFVFLHPPPPAKCPLRFKELEYVLIEKAAQLFQNML
jgi:hypothetical protein